MVTARDLVMHLLAFVAALAGSAAFAGPSNPNVVQGRFGFINKHGEFVIPPRFETARDFSDGIAIVSRPDKDGEFEAIDRSGAVKFGLKAPYIEKGFSDGLMPRPWTSGTNGDNFGYIDTTGKLTIPARFSGAQPFRDGIAEVWLADEKDSRQEAIIDTKGKVLWSEKENAPAHNNGFQIVMIGSVGFYTTRGQEHHRIWFSEGAAIADKQHLFGFIHPDGVFFIEPRFDEAHNFSEGFAHVKLTDGRHAFVNKSGAIQFTLSEEYQDAGDFHEGLAAVLAKGVATAKERFPPGNVGFVDTTGKLVIPTVYPLQRKCENIRFSEGLACVLKGELSGFIDRSGRLVIPYSPDYRGDFHEGLARAAASVDADGNPIPFKEQVAVAPAAPNQKETLMLRRNEIFSSIAEHLSLYSPTSFDDYKQLLSLDEQIGDRPSEIPRDLLHVASAAVLAKRWHEGEPFALRLNSMNPPWSNDNLKIVEEIFIHQNKSPEWCNYLKKLSDDYDHKPERLESLVEVLVALGDYYDDHKMFDEAEKAFLRAHQLSNYWRFNGVDAQHSRDGRWRIVFFYLQSGKIDQARHFFRRINENATASDATYLLRIDGYLNEYLARLYALDPKGYEADNRLVNFHSKENEAQWTFIDPRGEPIFSNQFTDAGSFSDGLANAATIAGWGFVDKFGKWVIAPQYYDAHSFSHGLAAVAQSRTTSNVRHSELNEAAPAEKLSSDLRYGFIDKNGKQVIPPTFFVANKFSEGVAAVTFDILDRTNGFGYIDEQGKTVIEPQYSEAAEMHDGVAVAQKFHSQHQWRQSMCVSVGRAKFYRLNVFFGNQINSDPAIADRLRPFPTSKYIDSKFGFENRNGVVAVKPIYDSVDRFSDGLAAVQKGDFWGFVDAHGTLVIAPQFEDTHPFDKGVAQVKRGGAWSLIDAKGKAITDNYFVEMYEFSEGLAAVKDLASSKYGFINAQGKIVILPTFSEVRSFKNGYAAVKLNYAWGFIDKSGTIVVAPKYIDVRDFSESIAAVREH